MYVILVKFDDFDNFQILGGHWNLTLFEVSIFSDLCIFPYVVVIVTLWFRPQIPIFVIDYPDLQIYNDFVKL
jgi:hypothetical protein